VRAGETVAIVGPSGSGKTTLLKVLVGLLDRTEGALEANGRDLRDWDVGAYRARLGVVMQDDNVKVSAILVEHPPVKPALAYRFDFKDRSIAFSGDTAPLEAVATMAKGADVLVHETMYVPAVETYIKEQIARGRPVKFEPFMAHMKADHTPSEDVGRIAQKAGVKTLVLSHLTPAIDSIDDDTWRGPAAKYFQGEIVVGKDLMVL
jgi:ribonuclease BN (tRNA processing enzyme)